MGFLCPVGYPDAVTRQRWEGRTPRRFHVQAQGWNIGRVEARGTVHAHLDGPNRHGQGHAIRLHPFGCAAEGVVQAVGRHAPVGCEEHERRIVAVQEDFPGRIKPDQSDGRGDGLVIVLEADQHVAGVESKHHGPRGPAFLPGHFFQYLVDVPHKVGQSLAVAWGLLHGLYQADNVGVDLFLAHVFLSSMSAKLTVFLFRVARNA